MCRALDTALDLDFLVTGRRWERGKRRQQVVGKRKEKATGSGKEERQSNETLFQVSKVMPGMHNSY